MALKFEKATLQEVTSAPSPTPQVVGSPIEVQINPASLRLQMSNNVDMGKAFARPNTQYQGTSSSTLSFDLVFDTADEGSPDQPADVRKLTRQLELFLLPKTGQAKAVPPRVKFTYGTFALVGVMSALNQEFDYFALNGVPLRAKCAVTIKEQKPEFDANLAGPGANKGLGAQPPLPGPGSARATPAPPAADRTGTALDGESASDFANRMGIDPKAWKGLAANLPDPLRLEAGLQIDFSASLSLGVGLGVEIGATAGLSSTGDFRRRRAGGRPAGAVPAQPPAEGAALTAMGGLTRALDRAAAATAGEAAQKAAASFQRGDSLTLVPALGPGPPIDPGPRPMSAVPAGNAAAAPVTADPRAISFGFGVPLRERVGVSRESAVVLVHERRRAEAEAEHGVLLSRDPTVPKWEALPLGAHAPIWGATVATTSCSCGCRGAD